ncbi:hypothetical protein C8R42DRAFT_709623 [Lentinula raphanica]|nr:hypothetical protein C8R42DRAFT_709623 [Lentinula raphanica]
MIPIPDRFQQYLKDVESGKKSISSAMALLPHQIVTEVVKLSSAQTESKYPKLQAFKKELAETRLCMLKAQWFPFLRTQAVRLGNSLAICDVSGFVGALESSKFATLSQSHQLYP